MARIRKDDHPRILRLVDVERRTVREIAAEFGCTPAAIYALLSKLRREAGAPASHPPGAQPPLALEEGATEPLAIPASAEPVPVTEPERRVVAFERAAPAPATAPAPTPKPAAAPMAAVASASSAVGGKLAKPGMGLFMRTPDGEETMTPFRSIDDLLSAIKPILRAGARSPDPVWFSIQPVDLSSIDVEAA